MRKLKLEIEQLQVESFTADSGRMPHGTVRGAQPDVDIPPPDTDAGCYGGGGSGDIFCFSNTQCVQQSVCNTCSQSCNGTCAPPGQMCA